MIGSEAAFSLPWRGRSMAILIVPFDESPAGFGELGVRPPVPPLEAGVDAAGVEEQAPRTSTVASASAPSFPNFMHVPPRTPSTGGPVDLGRCRLREDPATLRAIRRPLPRSGPSVDHGRCRVEER